MSFTLETPRLRLREVTWDDLPFLTALHSDPDVMRFFPKLWNEDDARGWIEFQHRRYQNDGHGFLMVLDRVTGEPVGRAGLAMQDVDGAREPEIGYMISSRCWRRGYATEAALAIREYAFQRLGYPYVISLIRPDNAPSQGVARKLGMRLDRETTFPNWPHRVCVYLVRRSDLPE